MILYLTGFSGCGKSTIARKASRIAGCGFIDTDREVEKLQNAKVSQIFADKGESYFRQLESRIIGDIARKYNSSGEDVIVATGGGLPCFGDNMELLNSTGMTVYLSSSNERLFNMLRLCRKQRPLVAAMDDEQLRLYIRKTMSLREPFYRRSEVVLECDGLSDLEISRRVVQLLAGHVRRDL